jgi:threonine/homoserine/homoserine lactone efflux protein
VITYLILGMTYAFTASVQPGPLQAYLVSQALRHGWRRALPGAFSPLVSDGPIVVLVLLVLSHVPPGFVQAVRCVGGLFLLYLALGAFRDWRAFDPRQAVPAPSAGQSLLGATMVNLANPGPYLGWSLIMGPLLLKGWREAPANGIALVVGFYGVMVLSQAVIIVLFATSGRVGPRINRGMLGLSALALAGLGCWQLWWGLAPLWAARR